MLPMLFHLIECLLEIAAGIGGPFFGEEDGVEGVH